MSSIFTQAVHAGERQPAPEETPVTTPIYHSVGYLEPSAAAMEAVFAGEQAGYVYRRYESPTVDAFERAVATLEGGEAAFATASGMAAVHAALLAAGVRAGRHVVAAPGLLRRHLQPAQHADGRAGRRGDLRRRHRPGPGARSLATAGRPRC